LDWLRVKIHRFSARCPRFGLLFRIAAQQCDESLEHAWMIGDNPTTDICGATALGVSTAWIRMARRWPEDLDYRPTLEVDSLQEAVDSILNQL